MSTVDFGLRTIYIDSQFIISHLKQALNEAMDSPTPKSYNRILTTVPLKATNRLM